MNDEGLEYCILNVYQTEKEQNCVDYNCYSFLFLFFIAIVEAKVQYKPLQLLTAWTMQVTFVDTSLSLTQYAIISHFELATFRIQWFSST